MKTIVIKRPDQPEFDSPYYAALDGDEYQVIEESQKNETYPKVICMCPGKSLALCISDLINNVQLVSE